MAMPGAATRRGVKWWDRQGLRAGLVAGIGFAVVELLVMAKQEGWAAVARLLRRIAAMWIGAEALDPGYPFARVLVVAVVLHVGLSALFGLVFAWVSEAVAPRLVRSRAALLGVSTLYGLALWPFNVYVVAPLVGWGWFAGETDPIAQAAAHAVYGFLLGLFLYRRVARWRTLGLWPWPGHGGTPPQL